MGGYDFGLSFATSSGASINSPVSFQGGSSAQQSSKTAIWIGLAAVALLAILFLKK